MSPAFVSMIGNAVSDPPPSSSRELRGAFQEAAVEVEDVARIGLTPRRAAEQQRQLTVGLGLFGEVVVDDQRRARPRSIQCCPIAQPAYGARYLNGAGSEAGAATTTVYSSASCTLRVATVSATVDPFCPIAT